MSEALTTTTSNFLDWIDAHSPKDVVKLGNHMVHGRETKYVTVTLDPKKYKTVEIIHLTDVQFGHTCCNVPRLVEFLEWILAADNRFVVFGGDMVDAATQMSKASPYENLWQPSEQCLRVVETLLPIRHRVLGYVGGNHERRASQQFGSLGLLISTLLKVPFSSGQQFIDINYGKHGPFKIDLWHGKGAGQTKGAKAMMIERYHSQSDAHISLVGHLHDCLLLPIWKRYRENNQIKLRKTFTAMSSSFLDFFGSYAEVMALMATDMMMVRIVLEPNGKWEVSVR